MAFQIKLCIKQSFFGFRQILLLRRNCYLDLGLDLNLELGLDLGEDLMLNLRLKLKLGLVLIQCLVLVRRLTLWLILRQMHLLGLKFWLRLIPFGFLKYWPRQRAGWVWAFGWRWRLGIWLETSNTLHLVEFSHENLSATEFFWLLIEHWHATLLFLWRLSSAQFTRRID